MKDLIATLSLVRKAQGKFKNNGKVKNEEALVTGSDADLGIRTIMAKHVKGDKKMDKTIKKMPPRPAFQEKPADSDRISDVSVSDVSLDFNQTLKNIQSKTAVEAFNTMQLVVRTMTGVFPDVS